MGRPSCFFSLRAGFPAGIKIGRRLVAARRVLLRRLERDAVLPRMQPHASIPQGIN